MTQLCYCNRGSRVLFFHIRWINMVKQELLSVLIPTYGQYTRRHKKMNASSWMGGRIYSSCTNCQGDEILLFITPMPARNEYSVQLDEE